MTRSIPLVVAGLALAACGASGARTHGGSSRSCGPAKARTLAHDSVARIYQSGSTVYGCSAATRHRTTLGSTAIGPGRPHIQLVKLAGAYAASAASTMGVDTGQTAVIVTRLRDGRQITSQSATNKPLVESFSAVKSLVLRDDGAVAWIGSVGSVFRGQQWIEVHKVDRAGVRVLDQGNAIDPKSLRLQGKRLTWRDGSSTRSATLD